MELPVNRRNFIKNAVGSIAGFAILQNSHSTCTYAANEKLNIALIGIGGRGSWFVETIPRLGENVVAMCDVNERKAQASFEQIPQAKKYRDYRKMLEEMDKQTDAVIIATPDHTHAVASAMAMKMGKHVFCEKPLAHNIQDSRTLKKIAAEYKVATQMGNQGTSSEAFRSAVEIISAGILGEIREVHAWNTGGGPGEQPYPSETHPIPEYLNWDLWLGPAKYRPYNSRWLEGWHGWRDFGTGQLGNWASHTMNLAFKVLKLDSLWKNSSLSASERLIGVEAEVSGIHKETFPRWESIRYDFPPREGMPAVRVNWYNGAGKAPSRDIIEKLMGRQLDWGDAGQKKWDDHAGCLLVGEKGMLHSTGHNMSFTLLPENKFKDFKGPAPSLPRSPGHEREWLEACKGGPPAMSNFVDYSGPLTEFVLLGNVATLIGQKIEFDPMGSKIVNNTQANEALSREYRQGWSL